MDRNIFTTVAPHVIWELGRSPFSQEQLHGAIKYYGGVLSAIVLLG